MSIVTWSLFWLLGGYRCMSQDYERNVMNSKIDKAEIMMDQALYYKADSMFRNVLSSTKVLPGRLAYLFGKNSYHLGKYKQSINWLTKYIELKGVRGTYYEDARQVLKLAEDSFVGSRVDTLSERDDEVTPYNATIECDSDKVLCPVCKGSGVVVLKGNLGNVYKTCPYSGGEGYLSCDEYNKFIKGDLDVKN